MFAAIKRFVFGPDPVETAVKNALAEEASRASLRPFPVIDSPTPTFHPSRRQPPARLAIKTLDEGQAAYLAFRSLLHSLPGRDVVLTTNDGRGYVLKSASATIHPAHRTPTIRGYVAGKENQFPLTTVDSICVYEG